VYGSKWLTFSIGSEKFNEYFTSKVKDPTKFYEFEQAIFYIHTPIEKVKIEKVKSEKVKAEFKIKKKK
jgi:hypothetical protein